MSYETPSPDQEPPTRRLSEQLSAWEHIEPQHTRGRPPHLESRNFSPADMNGPVADTHSVHTSRSRVSTNSDLDSGNTDSTARGESSLMGAHLYDVLNRDYSDGGDSAVPLTEPALRALDCESSTRPYPGDVAAWAKSGQRGGEPSVDISSSMIVAYDHSRTAATTHDSLSSWDVVLAPTVQSDRTAEVLADVGGQFADSSDSYHLYGPGLIIPD